MPAWVGSSEGLGVAALANKSGSEGRAAKLLAQCDSDKRRRVRQRGDAVYDTTREIQELPSMQNMGLIVGSDLDGALDALDRDFAGNAVRRQRLACQENQAHDLQIRGLEQRERLLLRQTSPKGLHVDGLARKCVRYCHGAKYAPGVGLRRLTFELRRERRCGAWPAGRMMNHSGRRAKCHAGASRLERRVRPHCLPLNWLNEAATENCCATEPGHHMT